MFRTTEHYSDPEHASEPEPLHACTLADVGRELGISRELARRVESLALRKVMLAWRILDLAPPGEAFAIVDSLRGAPLEDFRETYRRLKGRATSEGNIRR